MKNFNRVLKFCLLVQKNTGTWGVNTTIEGAHIQLKQLNCIYFYCKPKFSTYNNCCRQNYVKYVYESDAHYSLNQYLTEGYKLLIQNIVSVFSNFNESLDTAITSLATKHVNWASVL